MDGPTAKRFFGWLVLGVAVGVLTIGCGTVHVPVRVTHPAEINMAKYKQVAINEIKGNLGEDFSSALKDRLDQNQRFTMVDRSSLNQVLTELQLSGSDLAQSDKAAKMGQLLPATAIINGTLTGRYNEKVTYEDETRYRNRQDKVGYRVRIFTRTGSLDTSGGVQVVDVSTAKILKHKSLQDRCQYSTSAEGGQPEHIDQAILRRDCVNKSVDKFMKAISPWSEMVQAPFQTDGDIPMLEAGVNRAKVGDMQGAAETFQEAAKSAEMNPKISPKTISKAYFNLGLAYQYSDRFDDALIAFDKSYRLDPSGDCAKEMAHCKRLKMEKKKLDEQNQTAEEKM
jgi:curli biogenesis system outer membrane secretion channel CsgG